MPTVVLRAAATDAEGARRFPLSVTPGEDAVSPRFHVSTQPFSCRVSVQGIAGATVEADAVLSLSCDAAARLDIAVHRVAPGAPALRLRLHDGARAHGDIALTSAASRLVTSAPIRWPVAVGLSLDLPVGATRQEAVVELRLR